MVFDDIDLSNIPIIFYTFLSRHSSPNTVRWIITIMTMYQTLSWIYQCLVLLVMMMKGITWMIRLLWKTFKMIRRISHLLIKTFNRTMPRRMMLMIMIMIMLTLMSYCKS
ncbi:TPA_asm: P overlapped [Cardamine alphacytorhabdovirus 1]|nr:TPA_asm: P overlapped [Cardamine alphacytorhabdovirus 1]